MQENNSLEKLCEYLEQKPAQEEIVRIFKSHPEFNEERIFPLDFYEQQFEKICTKILLKKAERDLPELNIRRMLLPREEDEVWCRDLPGNVYVYSKKAFKKKIRLRKIQYENLITVNDMPIIIESSLAKFPNIYLIQDKINKLYEKTEKKPENIIVTPEENLRSIYAKLFRNNGGLTAKFYTSSEEFRKEVKEIVIKSNLAYKNNK